MEAGEVVVLFRDSRGDSGIGTEDFSVNSFRGIHTALDYGDPFVKDVVDVGAGLEAAPLVEVGDRVMVGVGDVVFCPITLDNAIGVLLIAFTVQGIFYCHYMAK